MSRCDRLILRRGTGSVSRERSLQSRDLQAILKVFLCKMTSDNDRRLSRSSSSQFNCTLVIYDPSNKTSQVLDIPQIAHGPNETEFHLNGVDYDAKSGHIFIVASNAMAFDSVIAEGPNGQITTDYGNANYTGPNWLFVFDPVSETFTANISLVPVQNAYQNLTSGNLTNGFQDMAEMESTGDSYTIGTFGNSIGRIPYGSQEAVLWYAPPASNLSIEYGFGGIVSVGEKLVVSDSISGGLVTFDTAQHTPVATYVPLQGLPSDYRPLNADGLYAPSKYDNKVILWSDDYNGTSVYGSNDSWATAQFLGLIPNDDPAVLQGTMTTATFEIGNSVYVLTQVFQYSLPIVPKRNWPFYDITLQLDSIVKNSFLENSKHI